MKCTLCGRNLEPEQATLFDGQMLCLSCMEEETVLCESCGTRIWQSNNAGDADLPLCQHCREHLYIRCERCGVLIRESHSFSVDNDDEELFCEDCYHHVQRRTPIHEYHWKPTPVFHGKGPRFYGVELEVDGGGELKDHALQLLDIANDCKAENLYIKHDGSLDDGFELVTHPMSLEYHLSRMPWNAVLEKAIELGYTSHQTSTCGLHIHVSREAFGESTEKQDAAIARVLYFVEKMWSELLIFSRRTVRQLERWASRYGYREEPKAVLDHAKQGGVGRYAAVNVQNEETIEFRLFRGTLKLSTVFATLQLVDRICDVAVNLTDDELRNMAWSTFVKGCSAAELVSYLKVKQLYTNEPVAESEEI